MPLTQQNAKTIINSLGSSGQPPPYHLQEITVGLDSYLSAIETEYLSSFVKDGGAAFKLVVGVYGGGKTHFLYSLRELAWRHNYAVSYVSLSSGDSPFYKLELVYKAIASGMMPPSTPEEMLAGQNATGIVQFLKAWYGKRLQHYLNTLDKQDAKQRIREDIQEISGLKSTSFENAIRNALLAIHGNRDDDLSIIGQWLQGENYERMLHRKYQILQKIDKSTAFQIMRSLNQTVRQLGYSGLVILLDEAERIPGLTRKNRDQCMANLRELVDECTRPTAQGVMIFYAVPDESFLEGRTGDYEALKMRLSTVFDDVLNPSGIKINLEDTVSEPIRFLSEVGQKLQKVYETAYGVSLDPSLSNPLIDLVAKAAHEKRFGDEGYKRLFVQKIVQGFHYIRQRNAVPSLSDLDLEL